MTNIGFQVFAFSALLVALLLAAFAVYVRIRSSTYTEKRFSFVALWASTSVVLVALYSITDNQLISAALHITGLDVQITTLPEKALIVVLAAIYCSLVRSWALNWNGVFTQEGLRNRSRGHRKGFVAEGIQETVRIVTRQPPAPVASRPAGEGRKLLLTSPLDELPFHQQVRSLIEAKWTEFEIPADNWVGELNCWLGRDRAFKRPLLVCCYPSAADIQLDRVKALADQHSLNGGIQILCVCSEPFKDSLSSPWLEHPDWKFEALSFDQLVHRVADFEQYRRAIFDEFKTKRLPDATFAIADILAPTKIRLSESTETTDFQAFIFDWLIEETNRQLALLGEYGQGKSTAVLYLTYELLFNLDMDGASSGRIPILIRLTGRSPSNNRLGELLGAWGAQYNLSGSVLLALHRAGRLLLIFDAFDEMANVMDRTTRFEHFDALWEFASPGAKVLFTGRPNFFLDDEELKEVLGINRVSAVGAYCEALRVAPFDLAQISTAVSWLPELKRAPLVHAIGESDALREVCCRPSLLYLIAHLWYRDRLDLAQENVKSASIIREFISYSLERQVQKQREEATAKRPERQFLSLTKSELEYFTAGIAVAALTEGRQNSIPSDVFETRIQSLYSRIPSGALPPSKDEVGGLSLPIGQRFIDLSNPIEACAHAVRTHGVIEHDVSRSRHYKFSHKSFAEVLAAETLKGNLIDDDDRAVAIEQANGVSLIDLAEQVQIIEFAVDFVVQKAGSTERVSYSEIYKRIFKSRLDWSPIVRVRSIVAAAVFLIRVIPAYRMVVLMFWRILLSFSVVILFGYYVLITPWPGPFEKYFNLIFEPLETIYRTKSWLLVALICVLLSMLGLVVTRRGAIGSTKLFLLSTLCQALENKGVRIYRTAIEKRAHALVKEFVENRYELPDVALKM